MITKYESFNCLKLYSITLLLCHNQFCNYVVLLGNDTAVSCTNRYWNTSQKCKTGVCISKGSRRKGKLVTHTINLSSIQVKYYMHKFFNELTLPFGVTRKKLETPRSKSVSSQEFCNSYLNFVNQSLVECYQVGYFTWMLVRWSWTRKVKDV